MACSTRAIAGDGSLPKHHSSLLHQMNAPIGERGGSSAAAGGRYRAVGASTKTAAAVLPDSTGALLAAAVGAVHSIGTRPSETDTGCIGRHHTTDGSRLLHLA